MLTAVWIYITVAAVICGVKAAVALSEEKVGMGLLHAAEATFAGFCAHAVWAVA